MPKQNTPQFESALTLEEWEQLEAALFDGAGKQLRRMREYARYHYQPSVGFVITAIQYLTASLPPGTYLDAGIGPACLNMFTIAVGKPGQGKDTLMNRASTALRIYDGDTLLRARELPLGSGEGIAAQFKPESEGRKPAPVLFTESEAGNLGQLMNRQGATLRQTLLKLYSGGSLGSTNKSESTYVEAASYTAGLIVGMQPDKGGAILAGEDDGFRHRFMWTELIDPTRPEHFDDDNEGIEQVPELLAVTLPSDLSTAGVTFAADIVLETKRRRDRVLRYGVQGNFDGHSHLTRLKLAAGLALLRSCGKVSKDDWKRAGVLMDYSRQIQQWCVNHLETKALTVRAERARHEHEAKAIADDAVREDGIRRAKEHIFKKLDESDDATAPRVSVVRNSASANYTRPYFDDALNELVEAGTVHTFEVDGVKCMGYPPTE